LKKKINSYKSKYKDAKDKMDDFHNILTEKEKEIREEMKLKMEKRYQ